MKKILAFVLLMTVVLSVSAFAAPAKVATAAQSSQAAGMKFGVGSYNGLAGLKIMGDAFNSVIGLMMTNTSAGGASNTTFGAGANATFNLSGGTVPTHAGAGLTFTSFPNGSTFMLSAIYGAETTLLDHLNIGVDIFPLSFSSTSITGGGSQTTFTLLTGTVFAFYAF